MCEHRSSTVHALPFSDACFVKAYPAETAEAFCDGLVGYSRRTFMVPTIVANSFDHLNALKLPTFARDYEKVAMESAQDRADYPRYLLRLCELERIDRERRVVERLIRLARFPHTKSFDTFEPVSQHGSSFAAQPSLNKSLVLEQYDQNGSTSAAASSRLDQVAPAKPTPPWPWVWPLVKRVIRCCSRRLLHVCMS